MQQKKKNAIARRETVMFEVDEKVLAKVPSRVMLRFIAAYYDLRCYPESAHKSFPKEVPHLSETHFRNCMNKGRELSSDQWPVIGKLVGVPDLFARIVNAKMKADKKEEKQ